MNRDNYFEIVNSNYEKVFDHFEEQDHLRNEALTFFTAVSSVVIGFASESKELLIANFILGIFFSILLCRYKYYGNLYNATMKILRFLSLNIKNLKRDRMQAKLDEAKDIKFNFYSADFLIYACLILINSTLLFFILADINKYIRIVVCILYLVVEIVLFNYLVISKTKKLELKNLSFIDMFLDDID